MCHPMEAPMQLGASMVDAPPGTPGGTHAPRSTDDRAILDAVRAGDNDAFGALYSRHVAAVRRLARRMAHDHHEADDIVSDVFANTLRAIRHGRGPRDDAQAYLLRSVRHTAGKLRGRKDTGRSEPVPIDRLDRPVDSEVHLRSDVEIALGHLPDRHRDVLWATCVEGRPASEVAAAGGLDASCVTSLALRARRALGRSYLLQRTTRPEPTDRCHRIRTSMPGCLRDEASASTATTVHRHIDSCEPCREVYDEMSDLDRSMCSVTLLGLLIAVVRGWLRFGSTLTPLLTKPLASALVAGAVVTGAVTIEPPTPDIDATQQATRGATETGATPLSRPPAQRPTRAAASRSRAAVEPVTTRSAPITVSPVVEPDAPTDDDDILRPRDLTNRQPSDPSPAKAVAPDPLPSVVPPPDTGSGTVLDPVTTAVDDVLAGTTDLTASVDDVTNEVVGLVTETVTQVETIADELLVGTTAVVDQAVDDVTDVAAEVVTTVGDVADEVVAAAEPITTIVDDVLDPLAVPTAPESGPTGDLVDTIDTIDTIDTVIDDTVGSLLGALGSGSSGLGD